MCKSVTTLSSVQRMLIRSRRFASYTALGTVGTALHFTVLFSTIGFLDPPVASTLGAVAGCVVNYLLARHIVFATGAPGSRAFPRFVAVAGIGILLNAGIMRSLVDTLPVALCQAVASLVIVLLGYCVNRHWTFNDPAS